MKKNWLFIASFFSFSLVTEAAITENRTQQPKVTILSLDTLTFSGAPNMVLKAGESYTDASTTYTLNLGLSNTNNRTMYVSTASTLPTNATLTLQATNVTNYLTAQTITLGPTVQPLVTGINPNTQATSTGTLKYVLQTDNTTPPGVYTIVVTFTVEA